MHTRGRYKNRSNGIDLPATSDTMTITTRRAVPKDLEAVQKLFVETIKSTCKNDYSPAQISVWTSSVQNKERWLGIMRDQHFLVAEIENTIVGFGSLENGNYLDFLYVHKDYLRRGVANYLYQELLAESQQQGFDRLTSDVSKTARPFFETKGFIVVKENKMVKQGVEISNYHMELCLPLD